jgi:hypothetical protein
MSTYAGILEQLLSEKEMNDASIRDGSGSLSINVADERSFMTIAK